MERWTERQIVIGGKQTIEQRDRKTDKLTAKKRSRQTNEQTNEQTCSQIGGWTDMEMDGLTDKQIYRKADGQTDR